MMEYFHEPVLKKEVLDFLQPKPGQTFIDGTLGGGGHAQLILEKIKPKGTLIGFDRDPIAIAAATKRFKKEFPALSKTGKKIILLQDSYWHVKSYYDRGELTVKPNGILLDLGLSSQQLTDGENRGFSFKGDQPLDMRFGPDATRTAADILNKSKEDELYAILKNYGEEPQARAIAKKIILFRARQPLTTASELVAIIEDCYRGRLRRQGAKKFIHPATRTFQALRIAVNDELDGLKQALPRLLSLLPTGGRLVVISYHSLEDRIVKQFFKQEAEECVCPKQFPVCRCGHNASIKILTKKPVIPAEAEIKSNPRSRSAKLRVAEKV